MQVETIGHYQVQLIPREVGNSGSWDAFFNIMKFDEAAGDFVCVSEKHPVDGGAYASYDAAVEAARLAANSLISTLAQ